jgi:ABC-type dipeptide/oligopeptide/nickel transport system permease component
MTTIVDEYLDTSTDMEDVFPCKGCGEVCLSSFLAADVPLVLISAYHP